MKEYERVFHASVHGVKYEPNIKKPAELQESNLSPEDQSKVQAHLERRMREKQREMQSNG